MDAILTAAEAGLSPELLDRVERGEEVVITRDGRPVARVSPSALPSPPTPEQRARAREAMKELDRLREQIAARGVRVTMEEILAMRHEGHRY